MGLSTSNHTFSFNFGYGFSNRNKLNTENNTFENKKQKEILDDSQAEIQAILKGIDQINNALNNNTQHKTFLA